MLIVKRHAVSKIQSDTMYTKYHQDHKEMTLKPIVFFVVLLAAAVIGILRH